MISEFSNKIAQREANSAAGLKRFWKRRLLRCQYLLYDDFIGDISWDEIGQEVVWTYPYFHRLNNGHYFAGLFAAINHDNVHEESEFKVAAVLEVIQTYIRELRTNHRDIFILSLYQAQGSLLLKAIIEKLSQMYNYPLHRSKLDEGVSTVATSLGLVNF